jgi:hypothetical protein
MRERIVIIVQVIPQGSAQLVFTDDGQMIETLSANRADYSFGALILERRSRRGDHFLARLFENKMLDILFYFDQNI